MNVELCFEFFIFVSNHKLRHVKLQKYRMRCHQIQIGVDREVNITQLA